jgi:hypothetical protein
MLEWRRIKAIRRLTWATVMLALFPGAFFVLLTSFVSGWSPESLVGMFPAALMGALTLALRFRAPSRPAVMEEWSPERELITPLPRRVEPRWWTPRRTLPALLWLFPVFYLGLVLGGAKPFDWRMVAALTAPGLLAFVQLVWNLRGVERQLLATGVVARGLIRWVVSDGGLFRMKVEYEFDGESFLHWTENLSPKTWFGSLRVEERKYVTLLVDPKAPECFVVYPFAGHLVPGAPSLRD